MPTPLKREDEIDEAYNYNPSAARTLVDAEKQASDSPYANDPASATKSAGDVHDAESKTFSTWNTNFADSKGFNKQPNKSPLKVLKRGGPAGIIIGLLLGGSGMLSFFGGPGMLLVNIAEIMTNKFNHQLGSMSVRTTKILEAKIKNTTTGVCRPVKINCKFASFSNKEIANFEKAHIKVNVDTNASKTLMGRSKIASFEFNGKTINAKDFTKTVRGDPLFGSAVRDGYNPKFAGFADKVFNKVANKLRISKADPFSPDTKDDESRLKQIQDTTKSGSGGSNGNLVKEGDKIPGCEGSDCEYTKETADQHNKGIASAGAIEDAAAEVVDGAEKAGSRALSGITDVVKLGGAVDSACTTLGMMNAVGFAAKSIRAAQMARYAKVLFTTASMIKAGKANNPANISYLGDQITKVVKTGNSYSKSGTDSFGYRYPAYGDRGINTEASQFLAGGGLTGKFASVTATVNQIAGGGDPKRARATCKLNNNPFVQAGSFLAGIALWIIPGGQAIQVGKVVTQAAVGVALMAAQNILPAMLADIVAGVLVDDQTFGDKTLDIAASGGGYLMSSIAGGGGNMPLLPSQARAYQKLNQQVLADNATIDRATLSPFDATSPNTFLGSIYSASVPYISGLTSTSGIISSVIGISTSSFTHMLQPSASAAAEPEQYNECQDSDYVELGIATDPFCNIVRGIPTEYLGDDPNTINDRLVDDIDPVTGEPQSDDYNSFVADCIDRDTPLGYTGDDGTGDDGSKCIIKDQRTADFAVHYIDMRISETMENGLPKNSPSTQTGGSEVSSATPEICKTLAATDLGQIACKAYQYDNFGYKWGGGHGGTAAAFLAKFKSGGFTAGKDSILDCSGLVRMSIFEVTGKDVSGVSTSGYPSLSFFKEVPKEQAKAGDIMWKPGHVEIIVTNNTASKKFATFGAHTANTAFPKQIGPSSWSYADTQKVLRFVG